MNGVSGQKSNLECISFIKFLKRAAGSCVAALQVAYSPLSFFYSFQFFLCLFSEPPYGHKHERLPRGLSCQRSFHTVLIQSLKGKAQEAEDCCVPRMISNLPSRVYCQAHMASLGYGAKPGSV